MEFRSLSRLLYLAAGLFVALWFILQTLQVLLIIFFAIVFTIVLNAPVTWLETKRVHRTFASLIVFFSVLLCLALLGWMVIPKMVTQIKLLVANLPNYFDSLNKRVADWLGDHGNDRQQAQTMSNAITALPPVSSIINSVGQYSIQLFRNILLIIFFFCLVIYMLIRPRPLLELYLSLFPDQKKEKAAKAFSYASVMTIGWMWSNIFAGAIRAIIVWFFLYFMGIPGMWVWAGVTFFAELIPKIGFYIMAVPPILIAFSISPVTALWVAIFYIVLDEIIGDFVIPRIRSTTMKIHPAFILIMIIIMSAAFGIIGAFIATPLAAFVKAYYETFYRKELQQEKHDKNIDQMLYRK
ncbi:MAG TPA: AI-2E family transporter [Chitinophagaceae bacterium]|jgi:predicted PurR-regulated permease PerM|nr:AI-2E family transporter [Chitinophagaceae bacterium]